MSTPIRVFAFGALTVVNEALAESKLNYEITRFITRQSVISGMSRPVGMVSTENAEHVRRALADANSSLQTYVRLDREKIDLLLWDITDERFGIELLTDQQVRTCSPDYIALRDELNKQKHREYLEFGTDRHFEEFQFAASRFISLLNLVGLGGKILVLAPEFAERFEGESETDAKLSGKELNRKFRKYWKYLHDVCHIPIILIPEILSEADPCHKWGTAPFHFSKHVYKTLGEGINSFAKRENIPKRSKPLPVLRTGYREIEPIDLKELKVNFRVNGEYLVRVRKTVFPVLLQLSEKDSVQRIPTVLSGAVSERQRIVTPIFSGMSLSKEMGLPLISIADPAIGVLPRNGLAWYAGSQWDDCQKDLKILIDELEEIVGKPLLLFGGSGAGFAAIDQMCRAGSNSGRVSVIWNPQLDIAQYGAKAVENFLATSYPSFYLSHGSNNVSKILSDLADKLDVRTELFTAAKQGEWKNILYLQQRADWHYQVYTGQLGGYLGVKIPESGIWTANNGVSGIVGTWNSGQQHVPPPREILENALLAGATGKTTREIASIFEKCLMS